MVCSVVVAAMSAPREMDQQLWKQVKDFGK